MIARNADDYNLLFRWFVGLGIDDPVWHPTAFTTIRDRLLEGEVAAKLLAAVLPPGGGHNDSRDFHGEQRRNAIHASTTDAEARLFCKGAGKEAKLCFMG
jgi:hypothetical protein